MVHKLCVKLLTYWVFIFLRLNNFQTCVSVAERLLMIKFSFFLEMEINAAGHIKWKFGKNISCVKAFCWCVDNCTYYQICLVQVGS